MGQQVRGYAVHRAGGPFSSFLLPRRELRADDIEIEITHCGICHTDVHTVYDDWHTTNFPVVPGHEIVGRVSRVGGAVRTFVAGNMVGVGCMIDACRHCSACRAGLEQYCELNTTWTYNDRDRRDGMITYGGFSSTIVVDQRFVVRIPDSLSPASAAPLLCAGITVYSPLRAAGTFPGMRIGIAGFGGLGHLAAKFARAMGAEFVVFTRSEVKRNIAVELGAAGVFSSLPSPDCERSLDLILDTVPVAHGIDAYLRCLKRGGTLVMVGLLEPLSEPTNIDLLISGGLSIRGSAIGGIGETAEMLEFCAKYDVQPDIEVVHATDLASVFETLRAGGPSSRYVLEVER